MQGSRLSLVLEIDPLADPVTGTIRGPGPPEAFAGWTQLGHVLDVAIERERERCAEPCPDADDAGAP